MSNPAWNWIPDGAISASAVLGPFDAAADAWNERWFHDFSLRRRRVNFGASLSAVAPVVSTARLDLRLSSAAPMALLSGAMNEDVSRVELSDLDWTVLEKLRLEMLEDLMHALDAALAGDSVSDTVRSVDTSGAVSIELADPSGRVLATVDTTRAILARVRLNALPSARRRPNRSLVSLKAAIARTPVRLEVRLGSTAIPLPEARRLSPGDVIILDRELDQPLDLAASLTGPTVACGHLVDASFPRSLRLEAAPVRVRP